MPRINVSLFSQVLQLIDRNKFNRIVRKHSGDKHNKGYDSWTQFVSMMYCHLGNASSVRDISEGLRSTTGNLVHLGIKNSPSKSSVSYQNKHRSWTIFKDMYFELLEQIEPSFGKRRQFAARLNRKIFLMDATVIPLCLSIFNWAKFRATKGGIKLHTILDYDSHLPTFIQLTEASTHDVKVAKEAYFPTGSVVVVDRAYVDFDWLHVLDSKGVTFVTRKKSNMKFVRTNEILVDDPHSQILEDSTIKLTGARTSKKYPKNFRLVRVWDEENQMELEFLTNQMSWTAKTISELYKARWDIEVFFKHIKQRLKIKTFIGTTPNAVLIQVWTAMITIALLKYLENKAKHDWSLSNLVHVLRINLFVKIDLWQWLDSPVVPKTKPPPNLVTLFD